MKKIKGLLKNVLTSSLILITSLLFISVLSYFNIINGTVICILELIICFTVIFIPAYKQGKQSTKYGFLEGIETGIIFIILYLIINCAIYNCFKIKNFIYYIIILTISTLGGMIGITQKKNS